MIRRRACLMLLPLLAYGQAQESQKCSMEGMVLDALSQQPVRKVEVGLRRVDQRLPTASQGVLTDSSGRFSFAGIEPGSYQLTAMKSGYLGGRPGARPTAAITSTLRLSAGEERKDITLYMTPQSVLVGKVVDEDGDPVQSASVQVLSLRYFRGRRSPMPVNGTSTNDKGEYRVPGLAPGKVMLMVQYPRQRLVDTLSPGQEVGYPALYYPGVIDLGQAARIDVIPGMEMTGYDLRLRRVRVYRMSGTAIHGVTGRPLRSFFVSTEPKEGLSSVSMASAISRNFEDGTFQVSGLTPGVWTIMAQTSEGSERLMGQLAVELGERNLDGLVVTVSPPQKFEGSLGFSGAPPAGQSSVRITLHPSEGIHTGVATAVAKPDGSFSFSPVYPKKYQLEVEGLTGNAYLESVRLGNEEMLGKELDLSAGAAPALQIRISDKGGSVSGTAQKDGTPAAGATVLAIPVNAAFRTRQFLRTGSTDAAGAFRLGGLAPMEYLVMALAEVEYGAWEDPDFLGPLESSAEKVRIEKSATANLQLKLLP